MSAARHYLAHLKLLSAHDLLYRSVMTYHFPPDIEERLKARMRGGQYDREDDVLRQAMSALDQLEQEKAIRWEERNQLAIQQSEQGMSKPIDDSAVLARLRE